MSQAHPPRIFISYSHKDSRLREQLEVFLARLKQQNVEIWSDTALKPGVEWDSKIRHQLSTADIILLLISPDFLASKYIIEKELQQVMERHENGEAAVIPIFLRPCDWKGEVFDKLQGLPSNGKPVTRWSSRDVPFTEIAEKIREIVNDRESKWVTHIGKIESTFQARVDSPRTSDTTLRRPMAWGNWEDLGGPINGQIASGPAVASWAANRLDCFAKGTDNHMWHRWWDGQWSNWEDLGGTINSAPAAVSWGPNRIDCFAHGMDNAMWHWWRDGQSSGWEDFGGPINGQIASGPAVASWAANRLDCFAKGTDNHMWHRWWEDGRWPWSNWEDLGGAINSAPAAVSLRWGPNRIDCFARGMNNAMWHRWWDGRWSNWEDLGGAINSAPAAVSWGPNRIDCFAHGMDNAMWHWWRDGQSSGWEDFGGPINGQIASGPAVASWAANRLACFAKGTDNHMWYRWWDGRWSNWEDLGGAINSAPAAVSWGPNRIDCFVRGMNNAMWHRWWA